MAFVAETARKQGHIHVLLITTGSVASIKAPLIVSELLSVSLPRKKFLHKVHVLRPVADQYENVSIQVVATNSSLEFYKKEDIEKTGIIVWTDADEWTVGLKSRHYSSLNLSRVYSKLGTQFFISNFDAGRTSF